MNSRFVAVVHFDFHLAGKHLERPLTVRDSLVSSGSLGKTGLESAGQRARSGVV